MFKIDGKYGQIHIDGMDLDIDRTNLAELKQYVQQLQEKREELIEKQNDYLSQIIQ